MKNKFKTILAKNLN